MSSDEFETETDGLELNKKLKDPKLKLPTSAQTQVDKTKVVADEVASSHTDASDSSNIPSTATENTVQESVAATNDDDKDQKSLPSGFRHSKLASNKPFQKIQFLVRDWQNFSHDWPDDSADDDAADDVYMKLKTEMKVYLDGILKPRGIKDLQSTRDQIIRCFDSVDCFLLPHPGSNVTKKSFDGTIAQIDPFFRAMINYLVRDVFDKSLEFKVINGRRIGGKELQTYFQVYVRTFQTSNRTFPKAMTLLDATAEANNRNAVDQALDHYKAVLLAEVGDDSKGYQPEEALQQIHTQTETEALAKFDEMASLGAESAILEYRNKLEKSIHAEWVRFKQTNRLRNPFIELERYKLPASIAAVAWLLATLLDQICTR